MPLALLAEAAGGAGKILMLEPRRLAARAVAARMASLLGEAVGATVGYRMRLDTRVSKATRIEVITEGVLTRLLQEDPALEGVEWLMFDEFHERSLQADLGLALALDAREQLEAAFRMVIMSATLEASALAQRLGDAAVVSVPGRLFEIEIHYLGRSLPLLPGAPGAPSPTAVSGRMVEQAVGRAVQQALAESSGDVLVFLPGVGEIRRVDALLRESGYHRTCSGCRCTVSSRARHRMLCSRRRRRRGAGWCSRPTSPRPVSPCLVSPRWWIRDWCAARALIRPPA